MGVFFISEDGQANGPAREYFPWDGSCPARYNVCRHYTMSFGHGRSAPDAMRRGIMSVDIIPYRIGFVKKRSGHESDADIYS